MLDSWGIVEDTDVGVDHLIISDVEDGWDIDGFLSVLSRHTGGFWEGSEGSLNSLYNLLVGNVTGSDDNHVVSVVVGGVEVSQLVNTDSAGKISISLDWLSEHVLSERVEMSVFKSGLNISVVVVFVLHADFILDELKLARVEGAVAENISEKPDGCLGISLKDLEVVAGELSIRVSRVSSSMVLNNSG